MRLVRARGLPPRGPRPARPLALALAAAVAIVAGLAAPAADPPAPAEDRRHSPDDVLVMIAADLTTLPKEEAGHTRYVSLRQYETETERAMWARLATVNLHDLSAARGVFPLVEPKNPRDAAGARAVVRVNPVLLRFNTSYFGPLFQKQWERLGKQEPYWHGVDPRPREAGDDGYEDVDVGLYYDRSGNAFGEDGPGRTWRKTGTERRKVKNKSAAVNKRGFFLRTKEGKDAYLIIQQLMLNPVTHDYGTDVPVVDADWLLGQTYADFKRDPGYHDFLGFNNLDEWFKLVGLVLDDDKVNPAFLQELRDAVGNSTVLLPETLRRIVHFDKPGGDVWLTQDSNQRVADFDPKANPLRELGDDYKFQAVEALGHLPNGFVAKGLFNNKGVRQDTAPDSIATDQTAPHSDKRVHEGLCFRCHKTGFQNIKGWARNMYNSPPNFLAVKDKDKRLRIQQQYVDERLDPFLESSRTRYAAAMKAAVGWDPKEYSENLAVGWKEYVEDPVKLTSAARRLGVTDRQLKDALTAKGLQDELRRAGRTEREIAEAVAVVTTRQDPLLSVYRPDKDGNLVGDPLPAVTFQDVFQRAADAVHGAVRPFDIREK
jgi:hypothetical protein